MDRSVQCQRLNAAMAHGGSPKTLLFQPLFQILQVIKPWGLAGDRHHNRRLLSVINQFDGPIITLRDGHFGKTFMQNSVGIATDAVLH
jgi:hypothetical protein